METMLGAAEAALSGAASLVDAAVVIHVCTSYSPRFMMVKLRDIFIQHCKQSGLYRPTHMVAGNSIKEHQRLHVGVP